MSIDPSSTTATPAISRASAKCPAAGKIPDFFIVGQPKSGTTALYEMLKRHPQIFIPDRKEPRFFASELYHRDPPRPGGTPKTLEEYASWFGEAGSDQLTADASPWYLWSHAAARRIAEARPDARIIATLREPASFLRSLHFQFVQLYVETETDLRKAIALEAPRREGRQVPRHTYWPQMLLYSEHVRYVEQLTRFSSMFAPEQMLILIYDDFRSDNEGTLRKVLSFLGLDDNVPLPIKDANPTVQVRSQRMHELVHAVSVGHGPVSRAVKGSVKALTPRALRRGALDVTKKRLVYSDPQPPDEALMTELRARFRSEVVALSDYLGRDLTSLWIDDRHDRLDSNT